MCFDLCGLHLLQVPCMVIISKHLLALLLSAGPSHSQHRRKLSLVVSGRGGSIGGAGKHRLLLSSTAGPFAGLNFQLKAC